MKQHLRFNRLRTGVFLAAFVCLLCLSGRVYAQNRDRPVTLDQAIQNAARHLFDELPEGSKIAIYDFDLKNINTISLPDGSVPLNDHIIEELSMLFSNNTRFTLVSRSRAELEVIAKEMNFQLSGDVSDDNIKSLGKKLEADFVLTGSISRVNRGYRLYVKPVTVETAKVFPTASPTIRENDPDLKNYLAEPERKPLRLTAGARAGVSSQLWTLSNDIKGDAESPAFAFVPVFHGAFHFTDLFALQTELALSIDKVSYSGAGAGGMFTASFESLSLQWPLLARFTFRPDNFSISAFGGIVFNIPLGAMNLNSSLYGDSSFRFSTPPGYVVGANAGWRLGPGFLFADIRFSGDFTRTVIHDNTGTLALYLRNVFSFSIGYEFEIIVNK